MVSSDGFCSRKSANASAPGVNGTRSSSVLHASTNPWGFLKAISEKPFDPPISIMSSSVRAASSWSGSDTKNGVPIVVTKPEPIEVGPARDRPQVRPIASERDVHSSETGVRPSRDHSSAAAQR